ncbi:MAG: hypothetical protein OQL28_13290 [Sedimenticola sp.]|nr:hypothetical protein [Sedimenticola sp.]
MSWLLLATGYDAEALHRVADEQLAPRALVRHGATPDVEVGVYGLHYTATALEVSRSCPHPVLSPDMRATRG